MKKANKIFPVILMAVLLYFAFYIINKNAVPQIITKESAYSRFYVQNDKVFINCIITIKNNSDEPRKFSLCAIMNDDLKGGLLKQPKIYAFYNDKKAIFNIKSDTKQTYDVVFVGDYGGNLQKHDRSLPQIEIISEKN
jgi:hypothetical protein